MTRAFSCYADRDPVITAQAWLWVHCLLRLRGISPSDVYVHLPPGPSAIRAWLEGAGVQVIEAGPFDARNKYCNKLQQLTTFESGSHDQVVLMDCDTAWVGNAPLPAGAPAAAKIVDFANPPEPALRAIFEAAGLGEPDWRAVSFARGPGRERTDANNCNGGLYLLAGDFLPRLAPAWRRWVRWCLDRPELFGDAAPHADQVGFALAMRELGETATPLDIAWNYPTHLEGRDDVPDVEPHILHYHRGLTPHLMLEPAGVPRVDAAVEALNGHIREWLAADLLNEVFWDFRYAHAPDLGSGVGSRGESLDAKRALLAELLAGHPGAGVLDVGCGDLEVTRALPIERYTGVDTSAAALRVAQAKRPDWTFTKLEPGDALPPADIVLCFDVLIHQPDAAAFADCIDRLAAAAGTRLIVSGYAEPPAFTSELTRYYEPLEAALRRTGRFDSIEVVGRYRDTVVLSAAVKGGVPAAGAAEAKVVVGTGWWCDTEPHDWALGAPATRTLEFFDLWYRQVVRCLGPVRVIVTDSAAPVSPDRAAYPLVEWVTLDRNYGHANDLRVGRIATKYSGFTRSVLNGAMYALCCDADYYVYVEQDCLLRGEGFLAQAIGDAAEEILLGAPAEQAQGLDGAPAAPMLQQSLMIVRRSGLERFISGLLASPWSDGERPPEEIMRTQLAPFGTVRVPYGRSRPIDFERSHFYAQHLEPEELEAFRELDRRAVAATPDRAPSAADPALDAVTAELDAWHRAGLQARVWWRDDDAAADTPALRRLLALAEAAGTVVALAVIPHEARPSLVAALAGRPCCIWQHGWRHRWECPDDPAPYHAGEFGAGRPVEAMMRDALAGQRAMDLRFGRTGWQRVFVPPFHALVVPLKRVLPSLGYAGLSSGDPRTPPIATVSEVNADVDLIDWPNRRFLGAESVAQQIVATLRARRAGAEGGTDPVGLLTHHLAMDDEAWSFMEGLLRLLHEHPAAALLPADRLFAPAEPDGAPGRGAVTVVVTSCGRQDLLERTLDSFLAHNTHSIHEFIVIEDGDGGRNAALQRKYAGLPFRWLATGERVGQVAAIDRAYAEVTTEYIFHCEDDWEFHASGFIEPSKTLLEHNPSLLQVWLRGLADTNRHPVVGLTLTTHGVPYRLLRHHHDAGEWGVWHGFSWNPGLRRRCDYERLGGFGSLDPGGTAHTWRVEAAAGAFYQAQGFFAAVLAGNGGTGYVRHVGDGRRVPRPGGTAPPAAPRRRSAPRDQQAGRLAAGLAASGAFARVPPDCGRGDDAAGVDEVPEWQVWTGRPTTPDQARIETVLEGLAGPASRILHIGVGNSSLGRRFAPRVARVLGTTIHSPEAAAAAGLGLSNYTVVCANKYGAAMDELEGPFEFIVDNNPASFACCLHHFARMWVAYVDLLAVPGGRVLTAQPGMRWVVTGNDPAWALGDADWAHLAGVLGMPLECLDGEVYALAAAPSSGAVWRGA